MSRRSWFSNARYASPGLVYGSVKFVTTNIGTNPDVTLIEGAGGLKGTDGASSVSNTGPAFVASITKTGNAGEFLLTFSDGWRSVWWADAAMWGPEAGPNDGKRACCTKPANQGSGHETAVTVLVTTHNENTGAAEETSGRTVCVDFVLKDVGVGA
jgi:hypothetical protein